MNISIEDVEKEAEDAKSAINSILGHFTIRTGCILELEQTAIKDEFGVEITGTKVEARVVLGVV